MATPLRKQVLDALKTTHEGITSANGYNTDVDTVEFAARAWDELATKPGARPWIGIVPQRSDYEDQIGYVDVTLNIDLLCHVTSTKTALAVMQTNSELLRDIRKALYTDPTLGVDGVIWTKVVGMDGSDASPLAAQEGIASMVVSIQVLYQEELDA